MSYVEGRFASPLAKRRALIALALLALVSFLHGMFRDVEFHLPGWRRSAPPPAAAPSPPVAAPSAGPVPELVAETPPEKAEDDEAETPEPKADEAPAAAAEPEPAAPPVATTGPAPVEPAPPIQAPAQAPVTPDEPPT